MLLRISVGFLAALAVYLVGAFIAVDFNIANWDDEGRGLVGLFMPVMGIFAATCPFLEGLKI